MVTKNQINKWSSEMVTNTLHNKYMDVSNNSDKTKQKIIFKDNFEYKKTTSLGGLIYFTVHLISLNTIRLLH